MFAVCGSAASVPYSDAVCQDALVNAAVEADEDLFIHAKPSQPPEKYSCCWAFLTSCLILCVQVRSSLI